MRGPNDPLQALFAGAWDIYSKFHARFAVIVIRDGVVHYASSCRPLHQDPDNVAKLAWLLRPALDLDYLRMMDKKLRGVKEQHPRREPQITSVSKWQERVEQLTAEVNRLGNNAQHVLVVLHATLARQKPFVEFVNGDTIRSGWTAQHDQFWRNTVVPNLQRGVTQDPALELFPVMTSKLTTLQICLVQLTCPAEAIFFP